MNRQHRILLLLPIATSLATAETTDRGTPPVKAPFLKSEDSLCVNDWWKRPTGEIIDLEVPDPPSRHRHHKFRPAKRSLNLNTDYWKTSLGRNGERFQPDHFESGRTKVSPA